VLESGYFPEKEETFGKSVGVNGSSFVINEAFLS